MRSAVIKPQTNQLTLSFDPGLSERHLSLRDCVASGIYQRGLGKCAIDLNKAPGNLSVELSEDSTRHFSVDNLEVYIQKSGDTTPIHYLIDKFLSDKSNKQSEAMAQLAPILAQLAPLMRQAGLA
jgi:hypothetical protein